MKPNLSLLLNPINVSNAFSDAQGDPTDVGTTGRADGTSVYAARRDHKHQIDTTELDARYVNVTGDTMTGDLTLPDLIMSGGDIYPTADSTTAIQINKADGSTNVLNVDTTNGRVGIGTTEPSRVLHVRNNSAGEAPIGIQNMHASGYAGFELLDTAGSSVSFVGFNNNTKEFRFNNTASGGYLDFMIGGASKVRVQNNGNVGIGTTAPAGLLDVYANSATDQMIRLWNAGGVAKMRFATADASEAKHQWTGTGGWVAEIGSKYNATADSQYLQFRVLGSSDANTEAGLAGATRMTILGSGNVGIGITAPLAKLHIDQATADAAIPVLSLDQADISDGFINYIGATAASAAGPISSWTAGNSIQGFVRVEINGAQYWMPYYDAPTS